MKPKPAKKKLLKLCELADATNLSRQTIQYYLLLDLITETTQTPGGQRRFDAATVKRVKLIHKLNQTGYALREIRDVFLKNRP